MPTNGYHYGHRGTPSYESYDGHDYDSPESSRGNSAQWEAPPHAPNGHFDDFNFDTPLEQRASHHISLNTRVHSHNQDVVGQHLLYEMALLDSQDYKILDMHEVDELKKEQARLESRIEAATRKLKLETKVKDAAQNLQRLYSVKKDGRPDTPQSPGSPKKSRNSLLGGRGRTGSTASQGAQPLHQAEDEVAQSIKKVDDLNEAIKGLMDRRQVVERLLSRHTAAVLADQAQRHHEPVDSVLSNGHRDLDEDEGAAYDPNEFDSIRDILRGKSAGSSRMMKHEDVEQMQVDHEHTLQNLQDRLEQLNSQLRGVIVEASQSRGKPIGPEADFGHADDSTTMIYNMLRRLEGNLEALESDREGGKAYLAELQDSASKTRNAVEASLANLSARLFDVVRGAQNPNAVQDLPEPPRSTGHGYQDQLQYLENILGSVEKLLQSRGAESERAAAQTQRAAEYESVLSGLWEILSAGPLTPRGSVDERGSTAPRSPLNEDFSLQAFNTRVQHVYDVASSAREQQDILRRQIQQQRDLNGKSDMEKDREIAEWQGKHDELIQSHQLMQNDLAKAMVDHQQAEREANGNRGELMNVMNEFEQLKRTLDTRLQERDDMARQLETHRGTANGLQAQVESLEVHIDELTDTQQKHTNQQKEMEDLESEVVRLTTELTIAKADLEGAYGTRAERQKEAGLQASELEALKESNRKEMEAMSNTHRQATAELQEQHGSMRAELADMTNEFQEMTRESLEFEKERGQLESLVDSLRDRCDALETQLSDEKVRWIGVQSPGNAPDPAQGRESMSVTVMRQEFKKMMRDARAEGVRHLRAEQEERRKLETELRKNRQANGPLGKNLMATQQATTVNGLSARPQTPMSLSPAQATN